MANKVKRIIQETLENGGYTWDITARYVVAKIDGSFRFKISEIKEIDEVINAKIDAGINFGTWIAGDEVYIDEVVCTDCKATALQIGLLNDQIAIYDSELGITINVSEVF